MIALIPIHDFYLMHILTITAFLLIGGYIVWSLHHSGKRTSALVKGTTTVLRESWAKNQEPVVVSLEKILHVGAGVEARIVYETERYQVWDVTMRQGCTMPTHKHTENHEVFTPISGCFTLRTYDADNKEKLHTFTCKCGGCNVDSVLVPCDTYHSLEAVTDCVLVAISVPPLEFDGLRNVTA